MTRVAAPERSCLSILTITLVPLVKRVTGLEIKENLITHPSENHPVIPPRPQETHYLHTTHTSCRLPASCTAGKRREWPLMSRPVCLHAAFTSHRKDGGYELPASKYLSLKKIQKILIAQISHGQN